MSQTDDDADVEEEEVFEFASAVEHTHDHHVDDATVQHELGEHGCEGFTRLVLILQL